MSGQLIPIPYVPKVGDVWAAFEFRDGHIERLVLQDPSDAGIAEFRTTVAAFDPPVVMTVLGTIAADLPAERSH